MHRSARVRRSSLAAVVLSLLAPLARAQQTPPLAGIAHIAIRVRSLDAARDFYQKLGYEEAFLLKDKQGKPRESFIKINDHQFIELYPANPEVPKESSIGFLHVCFEGDNDLQTVHDDYVDHGLTPTAVRKAGAGNLLFTLAGPIDANGAAQNLEYTQYEPGSMHYNDQGKHMGEDRIADAIFSVSIAVRDLAAARDFYLNQLSFKSIAGDPLFLHMPGNSGQEIELVKADVLGPRARFVLRSSNLSKARRLLHKQHISMLKSDDTLTLADPDGNVIMVRSM
jgi:catechol 2,3-dioxygenase-like lactoylglutathione lyase family enzyme